jgi:hypothetical protein
MYILQATYYSKKIASYLFNSFWLMSIGKIGGVANKCGVIKKKH